jgi:hypothetical protein
MQTAAEKSKKDIKKDEPLDTTKLQPGKPTEIRRFWIVVS